MNYQHNTESKRVKKFQFYYFKFKHILIFDLEF
jgi:hypothetical protein